MTNCGRDRTEVVVQQSEFYETTYVPDATLGTRSIFVGRAEHAQLWDVEGRRYIDFAAGIAVTNTGGSPPQDHGSGAGAGRAIYPYLLSCCSVRELAAAGGAVECNCAQPGL